MDSVSTSAISSQYAPEAKFQGIDISAKAAEKVRNSTVGDILNMPYESGSFDVAVCTLFFHHVADEGFEPYLTEIARILRPGGILVTMEPSRRHPVFAISAVAQRIVGNIGGHVEHEHPINIKILEQCARDCGFGRVETFACSFGHNRMPVQSQPC